MRTLLDGIHGGAVGTISQAVHPAARATLIREMADNHIVHLRHPASTPQPTRRSASASSGAPQHRDRRDSQVQELQRLGIVRWQSFAAGVPLDQGRDQGKAVVPP